jgi:hypothetical protein
MKKLYWLLLFVGYVIYGQTTIFSENTGGTTVLVTTPIASNTFQNLGILNYVGTADVRATTVSNNVGASGGNNVFVTNSVGRFFEISNIDTSNFDNITLSTGFYKSTTTSNGSELVIEVSSDGITYTPLSFTIPTGTGTAIWRTITPTGSIPTCFNLRIRFRQTSGTPQFRIDDVVLRGTQRCNSTTTWNGSSWSNGSPNSSSTIIINGDYDTAINGSIDGCSMIVNPNKNVYLRDNTYISLQFNLIINGTFNLYDGGNLVQIQNNGINTGKINYYRTVNNLNGYDYVYWSSPVTGQVLETIYTSPSMGFKYYWDPLANNVNSPNSYGNWITATGVMTNGRGYIVRGSSSFGWNGSLTTTINGAPNTGTITFPIRRGTLNTTIDDNWNLIGNPYPCSIDAINFLNSNPSIDGYICIWKHLNAPASTTNPFYGNFTYNYQNDYTIYNSLGSISGPGTFSGLIASGQGFFVSMLDTSITPGTITFSNTMKSKNQSIFYRQGPDKSRLWLDLVGNNTAVRTLIGYSFDATDGYDRMFDVKKTNNYGGIYSLMDFEPYLIQGKKSPIKRIDEIPIGVKINNPGSYTIAISSLDGDFQNYKIYLMDTDFNTVHNLKESPYTFTSNTGVFNDRFKIMFNYKLNIKRVIVYDMMAKKLFEGDFDSYRNTEFNENIILIVKFEMEDGSVITKKVLGL